ncbi:hypothetical protein [Aliidiomarina soli]|uniref:Uncharacterized protein n=1 Tax=Aliidiomarina soli TaxID=1928574 RepID=A0A432WC17_9GAMM|nr:hypothetical protein [Aliidiomarina soli]RUO29621.1 hypothetical protein CWE14_14275 [Aliidiomarina soli]
MNVTSLPGVSNLQTQRIDEDDKQKNQQAQIPAQPAQETRADLSVQGQAMAQRERDLASRFDVQNLTADDFDNLTSELEEQGLISELEASDLRALFSEGQKSLQSLNSDSQKPVNILSMLEEQVQDSDQQNSRAGGLFAMFDAMDRHDS